MGWVAGGGDDRDREPFPVDALVNDILVQLRRADNQCTGRTGQDRICCDAMVGCMADLKSDVEKVFSQDVDAQNIHRACRKTTIAYARARACVSNIWCHKNADGEDILTGFMGILDDVREKKDKHCLDLPPERTTMEASTTKRQASTTPVPTTQAPIPSTTQQPAITQTPTIQISPTSNTPTVTLKQKTANTSAKPIKTSVKTQNTIRIKSTTIPSVTVTSISPESPVSQSPQPSSPPTPLVASSLGPPHTKPPEKTGTTDGEPGDTTFDNKDRTTGVHGQSTSNSHGGDTSTPFLAGSTISSSQGMVNGSITGNDTVTSLPDNSDTAIIVGATVGGLLLLLAVLVVVIIKCRKEREGSNGSISSGKPFLWSFFSASKSKASDTAETEIYAEIDEAFMDAVYKVDQDRPKKRKNRPSTNSQINICYEAGLDDKDAIISAARAGQLRRTNLVAEETFIGETTKTPPTDTISKMTKSNELKNIPEKDKHLRNCIIQKSEDQVTSFQNGNFETGRMRTGNRGNPKGYMLSQPSFTDIRHNGNTYEDIPPSSGDYVEINEPIYEEPLRDNQTYDSANYGDFRDKRTVPEPNYSHIHVYKKTDWVDESHVNNEELDDVFYQNIDTMMEY